MNFREAFKAMKAGEKVKLPSWGGYWYWDSERETIMIQCRPQDADQGELLDIRETKRVEYTMLNMQSDEWMIANKDNCPALGGEATFSFGEAIKYVKRGLKVKRKGWNGKNIWLWLKPAATIKAEWCKGPMLKEIVDANGGEAEALGTICMKTADNKILTGWLASQTDMLCEDWTVLE